MNDKLTEILTNTKLVLGISGTVVGILFFFFMLRSDIKANSKDIQTNRATILSIIESNSSEYKEMKSMLTENQTSLKLLQRDIEYIKKTIDEE